MSNKKKHEEEDGGGHSVGLWYVSFSDMITLLLSFFVMLTTFSSYSKEDLSRFSGVWAQLADYSVFTGRHGNESLAPQPDRPYDYTMNGSEKPSGADHNTVESTGESQWLASMADAYSRRRVLHIPSRMLFWGKDTQGTTLMPAGKAQPETAGQVPSRGALSGADRQQYIRRFGELLLGSGNGPALPDHGTPSDRGAH